MKKIAALFILLFLSATLYAQLSQPVQWKFYATKKADRLYEILLSATIESPWHLYSQNTQSGGPVPTSITFKTNPLITHVGKVREDGKLQVSHDPNFDVDVKYYSNKVMFVQTVKLKSCCKKPISPVLLSTRFVTMNSAFLQKTIPFSISLQ